MRQGSTFSIERVGIFVSSTDKTDKDVGITPILLSDSKPWSGLPQIERFAKDSSLNFLWQIPVFSELEDSVS